MYAWTLVDYASGVPLATGPWSSADPPHLAMPRERPLIDRFEDRVTAVGHPLADVAWMRERLAERQIAVPRRSMLGRGLAVLEALFGDPAGREPTYDDTEVALGTVFLIGQLEDREGRHPEATEALWSLLGRTDGPLLRSRRRATGGGGMFEGVMAAMGPVLSPTGPSRGRDHQGQDHDLYIQYLEGGIGVECMLVHPTDDEDGVRADIEPRLRQLSQRDAVEGGWTGIDLTPALLPGRAPSGREGAVEALRERVHAVAEATLADTALRRQVLQGGPKLRGVLFFARCLYRDAQGAGLAHVTHKLTTLEEAFLSPAPSRVAHLAERPRKRPRTSPLSAASAAFVAELVASQRQALVDLVRSRPSVTLAELAAEDIPEIHDLTVGELVTGTADLRGHSHEGNETLNLRRQADRDRYDHAVLATLKHLGGEANAATLKAAVGGTRVQLQAAMNRWIAKDAVEKSGSTSGTVYRMR